MKIMNQNAGLALGLMLGLFLAHSGQCFYNASAGRWLSRDPIEERGGPNLHSINRNDFLNQSDRLGLKCCVRVYPVAVGRSFGHVTLKCDNNAYISAFGSAYMAQP